MTDAYQFDSELGYRLRPGIHRRSIDFHEEIQVNQLGTANFQENFDGYKTLIFALGDSNTQGVGLPADMSYPAQLDLMMNQDSEGRYTKQYGVVNLGVAAFGGEQSFLAIHRWSKIIGSPTILLYLGCDNDYLDDLKFKGGYRHRHVVAGSPVWGSSVGFVQWLTTDLQIGIRLKKILAQQRQKPFKKSEAESVQECSVAELEEAVLQKLVSYAQQHGALLVLSWAEEGESYDWLKAWSKSRDIPFADWAPRSASVTSAIPSIPKDNPHSAGHHRGWVTRLIAEEYARQIRENRN